HVHSPDEHPLDGEIVAQDDGVAARARLESAEVAPPEVIRGVPRDELRGELERKAGPDRELDRSVKREDAPRERVVRERRPSVAHEDTLPPELGLAVAEPGRADRVGHEADSPAGGTQREVDDRRMHVVAVEDELEE